MMLTLASCLFFLYYRSGRFSNTYADLQKDTTYHNEKTEKLDSGRWFTNQGKMYHTLSFEPDSSIVIDNHVDTLFRYSYVLDKNTLWLIHKTDSIKNKIKSYSTEELIFENFMSGKSEMRYTRTQKGPN